MSSVLVLVSVKIQDRHIYILLFGWEYLKIQFCPTSHYAKMFTGGEIITVAIILPDSLSPVKNPSNILDFGHDFDFGFKLWGN